MPPSRPTLIAVHLCPALIHPSFPLVFKNEITLRSFRTSFWMFSFVCFRLYVFVMLTFLLLSQIFLLRTKCQCGRCAEWWVRKCISRWKRKIAVFFKREKIDGDLLANTVADNYSLFLSLFLQ
jgi:hypothetical protein